ncbi:MAG: hypothetical protein EP339_14780 [Gammaproteobacteria bacterium]|uniref:DUF6160 domain-containing protein n=1 Tax=Marinobacter nitratireducens TaxID=1137280 RepID=A0A072N5P8_9GAMM|nr:DUF6160 family protein [Marinobacter nitratireducens]KEF32288.1 hypothetical protein D777_00922 [Marinobacter nitratireducens]TNE71444.1 MAG: hypothetical protein EP339_14780 [Gammaproteobacteria bacterium]
MKGLKKIALATAIAAAPFAANADLKALDDSAMGNVTGQAGVTIELETKVSIGQFKYTDEGSFAVNDIVLGGAGVTAGGATAGYTDLLDQLKIDIDVADDGDAIIHVGTLDGNPIDWGLTVGSMELLAGSTGTDSTTLISNMSGYGNLAQLDISVDTATDHLNVAAAFDVQDMDFDVEFLGVGIRDMVITGAGDNFDYNGDGSTAGEDKAAVAAGTQATVEGIDATTPLGQKMIGLTTQFANVNLDVYKGAGLGASTATDVLRIDVNNVYMDMSIGAVEIGGTSIGSLAIDNLAVTNTKLAVYGH